MSNPKSSAARMREACADVAFSHKCSIDCGRYYLGPMCFGVIAHEIRALPDPAPTPYELARDEVVAAADAWGDLKMGCPCDSTNEGKALLDALLALESAEERDQ